jgi:hypothetical protein
MHKGLQLSVLAIVLTSLGLAGPDSTGLRLTIDADKDVYAPFEPIQLEYWVENTSEADVSVPAFIKAHFGWMKFEIAPEKGDFLPYRTGVQATGMYEAVTLRPGERLSSALTILTNAYGRAGRTNYQYSHVSLFPFTEPGGYRIRASYLLAEPDSRGIAPALSSNTIVLSIAEPPDVERNALAFFSRMEEYAAAVGADQDAPDLKAAIPRWEEFVEQYPKSIYTPAVRMHLGHLYMNGTGMEAPDVGRAAEHFRAVAKSGASGLRDDAFLELAKSLIEEGRFSEAQTTLARLLADFPKSERATEAVRLRNGLAKGWRTLRDIYGN